MNAPNISSLDYMDSVPLQNMLRHVLPYVPELPQAMALDMLRQKYIDFARRTRLLCAEMVMDYQSGVRDYYLEPPEDHQVYSIIGVHSHTGDGLYWYGFERDVWRKNFNVVDNNCIVLHNTPSVDRKGGLRVFATLLPKACINYMPSSIMLPFGRNIGRGVVADALCIPNKEWTNPNLARKYELDYERMLLSARALSSANRKVDANSIKPVRIL